MWPGGGGAAQKEPSGGKGQITHAQTGGRTTPPTGGPQDPGRATDDRAEAASKGEAQGRSRGPGGSTHRDNRAEPPTDPLRPGGAGRRPLGVRNNRRYHVGEETDSNTFGSGLRLPSPPVAAERLTGLSGFERRYRASGSQCASPRPGNGRSWDWRMVSRRPVVGCCLGECPKGRGAQPLGRMTDREFAPRLTGLHTPPLGV